MDNNVINIKVIAKDLASGVFNNISKSVNSLSRGIGRKLATGVQDLTRMFTRLSTVGAGLATAFGGFGVNVAAQLETARQGFIGLGLTATKTDATIERLKKEAAATPFELPGLTRATQLLTAVTKDGDKSIDILLDVGKSLAAVGKGQAELDRIIVNLQQISATGRASALDIKQFAFAGIPIFELLTEATGKSGEALDDFITEGGVTFELLTGMFDKAASAGGRFENAFSAQAGTFSQLVSNMKDDFGVFAADFVTETGIFDALKDVLASVSKFIKDNKDSIVAFAKEGLGRLKDILEGLKPLFDGFISLLTSSDEKSKDFRSNLMLITGVVVALGIAFGVLSNPLVIIAGLITGIALLLAEMGIGADDIIKAFNHMKDSLIEDFNIIKQDLAIAFEFMKDVVQVFIDTAIAGFLLLIKPFRAAFQTMIDIAVEIYNILTGKTTSFKDGIINIFGSIRDGIISAVEGVIGPILAVWEKVKAPIDAIGKALGIGQTAKVDQYAKINRKLKAGEISASEAKDQFKAIGFADGGIVPGNSFRGDKVAAQLDSGEMILNRGQQRNLFNMIQQGSGGGAQNVTININGGDTNRIVQVIEDVLARQNINAARGLSLALN